MPPYIVFWCLLFLSSDIISIEEIGKSEFEKVLQMVFTAWLAIVYVLLIIITAIAFVRKKKVAGIITTAIMVLGIVVLGYLWFTSSM